MISINKHMFPWCPDPCQGDRYPKNQKHPNMMHQEHIISINNTLFPGSLGRLVPWFPRPAPLLPGPSVLWCTGPLVPGLVLWPPTKAKELLER